MSVVNFNINPGAGSQVSSPYGPAYWYTNPSNMQTLINPDSGAGWICFQIQQPGLPLGEVFNGVRLQGVHDFLVNGGAGTGRFATGLCRIGHSATEFIGAAYETTFGPVNGSGIGQNVNFVIGKAGYTSTDIVNGTLWVGFSVGSDNGNPGVGSGAATYRNAVLTAIAYTGADTPTPPISSTSGFLTNPTANTSPGKVIGQFFEPVSMTYVQPMPGPNSFQYRWSLQGPLQFAANGTQSYIISQGTVGNPGSPYVGNTGNINIPVGTNPGTYFLTVLVTGVGIADLTLSTSLVVPTIRGGFAFHEF
jgi:hypothetical protein